MGSSSSGGGLGDSVAGSIVWVRRRNGSWWPGKILGQDEMSASHIMSPRSGTPVKLLGREDASVDWYNLEKSKRVKAFRCGEFDDCIERAEASFGVPAKKREKYARREDAILHALELEKQILEKKYGKPVIVNSAKENSSESERKSLATPSGALENGNGKVRHRELHQLDKKLDLSTIMERNSSVLLPCKGKDGTSSSVEEHKLETSRRMRGLQDFGLRTVSVNKMICPPAIAVDSSRMVINSQAYGIPANDPCYEGSSDSDSRNSIGKGKRLLESFAEDSPSKRQVRNHGQLPSRTLHPNGDFIPTFGKQLTADGMRRSMYLPADSRQTFDVNQGALGQLQMVVPRHEVGNFRSQRGPFAEESISGSSEQTESDSSETHSLEPRVDAAMMLSDAETGLRPHPRALDGYDVQGGHESTSGSDESGDLSLDHGSQFYLHGPDPSGVGVSKWQLKGKRNVRNFSKRPIDRFGHSAYYDGRPQSMSLTASRGHTSSYYQGDVYDNDVDLIEDEFDPHMQAFGKRGYLPSQAANRGQNLGQYMMDWEDMAWGKPCRGYWDERGSVFNPMFVGRNGHGLLVDVEVQVQANHRTGGEHVPWVSLMSKLNGKAIIGHPIQIEPLEDGSTDTLFSASDIYDNDGSRVPQVWRTARRTANFRVPRPQIPSSQLDGDEDPDFQYFHQSAKANSPKPLTPKGTLMKKSYAKKHTKKMNQSSNQKTKALSSLGFDQKVISKGRENDTRYCMDGVLKPVDSGPPAVACIPVKLVFSRLLEAVGRPPSGPVKHAVSLNSGNKERNPS